jgi:hypothetical protein
LKTALDSYIRHTMKVEQMMERVLAEMKASQEQTRAETKAH